MTNGIDEVKQSTMTSKTIGILALQGDYHAHANALQRANNSIKYRFIKTPEQLATVDGLIMPGGESSSLLILMDKVGLQPAIIEFAQTGKPLLGTCAGLILLANHVEPAQTSLGLLDISVSRNAYGRQVDSFIATISHNEEPVELVFIRAPKITQYSKNVEVLLTYQDTPIMVKQRNITGCSFHPELSQAAHTNHRLFYNAFLSL